MDKKLLATACGYYLKAHDKEEKIANCFPDEWASDIDLQLAFKKGWKEAEDETPVEMNVTMDLTGLLAKTDEGLKELRRLGGEMERMHRNMLARDMELKKGAQTNTAIPNPYHLGGKVEIDESFIKSLDRGSCAPGKFTWDAATGKALDDFAVFYRIGPRAIGETDWHMRERIKYAHEHNHPNRYPGGWKPVASEYKGSGHGLDVDWGKEPATGIVSVQTYDGSNWKITPPDAYEANEKIAMDFAREYIENLGLERRDWAVKKNKEKSLAVRHSDFMTDAELRKRFMGQMEYVVTDDEPGVDYDAVENKWKEWQAANKKAFSEKEKVQVHNLIELDGEAIARCVNEYQKEMEKGNKAPTMTTKYEGSWKNEYIVNKIDEEGEDCK